MKAAHLSAAYTFSRTDKAQRNLKQNALCPDRCQGPAQRLQTSQKRGYPTSTNTQAPAACADSALACNTTRPNQLHTRFGGSRRDGLWKVNRYTGAPQGPPGEKPPYIGMTRDIRKTHTCCITCWSFAVCTIKKTGNFQFGTIFLLRACTGTICDMFAGV